MIFKLYDCDVGITARGTDYRFEQVENLQIEDPERVRLIRGANAGNKVGVSYREGLKEAKTITVTLIGIPLEIHELLKDLYAKQERMDVFCISRIDGSSKPAKNAVLSVSPKQLNLDDSAESMNTALVFESFDTDEIHKS